MRLIRKEKVSFFKKCYNSFLRKMLVVKYRTKENKRSRRKINRKVYNR